MFRVINKRSKFFMTCLKSQKLIEIGIIKQKKNKVNETV